MTLVHQLPGLRIDHQDRSIVVMWMVPESAVMSMMSFFHKRFGYFLFNYLFDRFHCPSTTDWLDTTLWLEFVSLPWLDKQRCFSEVVFNIPSSEAPATALHSPLGFHFLRNLFNFSFPRRFRLQSWKENLSRMQAFSKIHSKRKLVTARESWGPEKRVARNISFWCGNIMRASEGWKVMAVNTTKHKHCRGFVHLYTYPLK